MKLNAMSTAMLAQKEVLSVNHNIEENALTPAGNSINIIDGKVEEHWKPTRANEKFRDTFFKNMKK